MTERENLRETIAEHDKKSVKPLEKKQKMNTKLARKKCKR